MSLSHFECTVTEITGSSYTLASREHAFTCRGEQKHLKYQYYRLIDGSYKYIAAFSEFEHAEQFHETFHVKWNKFRSVNELPEYEDFIVFAGNRQYTMDSQSDLSNSLPHNITHWSYSPRDPRRENEA